MRNQCDYDQKKLLKKDSNTVQFHGTTSVTKAWNYKDAKKYHECDIKKKGGETKN